MELKNRDMRTMKRTLMIGFSAAIFLLPAMPVKAQSIKSLVQQVILDIAKYQAMLQNLKQMYKGYEIVSKGYNAVKSVSQGNFKLQDAFINGLLNISPSVAKYPKIAAIVKAEAALIAETRAAAKRYKSSGNFSSAEISAMMDMFDQLSKRSIQRLDELAIVITANKLRMSDAERLAAIDRIYGGTTADLTWTHEYHLSAEKIDQARKRLNDQNETVKKLYDIQ